MYGTFIGDIVGSKYKFNNIILVVKELHRCADALAALLLHQESGDAGINAAAHGNENLVHQTMRQALQSSQSGNSL